MLHDLCKVSPPAHVATSSTDVSLLLPSLFLTPGYVSYNISGFLFLTMGEGGNAL